MLGKTGVSRAENRYFRGKNMKKGTGFFDIVWGCSGTLRIAGGTGFHERAQETETIEDGVYISAIFMWAA